MGGTPILQLLRREELAMIQTQDCTFVSENLSPYIEGMLDEQDAQVVDAHLKSCGACRKAVSKFRVVHNMLGEAPQGRKVVVEPEEAEELAAAGGGGALSRLGGAPWWAVSLALHVLVIALASLVSMAIELPKSDDGVIMVTELQARQTLSEEEKPKVEPPETALLSKKDVPATDPTSMEMSDIVVPPDILAKAELGDHFETINPDKPDTHSAFGNEDSRSFHSVSGNAEPAGGGGAGGIGMEDVIGVGGAASKGTGGGFGGGDGTGTGVQSGSGHGSFGNRNGGGRRLMVKKHGGSKATESAVDAALHWLAYHQEPDGHWDSMKFGASKRCDTAVTGLATLAFLGAGNTERVGPWKDNVVKAISWFKGMQQPNGMIYDKTDTASYGPGYGVAMATMAMAEATGMANNKETRAAAQKAIDYCTEIHQNGEGSEKGGFRYDAKSKTCDISVTGWFVMAMKSAKVAGLHVNPASFEGASKFLDRCEQKNAAGGDSGYGPPSEYVYNPDGQAHISACTDAIGHLCRQFMGVPKENLQSGVDLFVKKHHTPKWGASNDLYYWYYGTLCVFQQGGDLWKEWNETMKPALCDNQCKNGDDAGSWTPCAGEHEKQWGRVGETALCVLCLEVYYRYVQLAADK